MAKTMPPVLKTPRWAEVNCHRRSSVVGKLSVFECLSAWRDKAWHQTYPLSTLAQNSNAAENRQVGFHIYHIWQKNGALSDFLFDLEKQCSTSGMVVPKVGPQAGTWLEESSGAWLCMNPQTNLCGIARGGTNTSTAPHTTRPPLVMLWRQQETRLGRMLIKNYRTKYGMNGRKRVEFCRKTALPATSVQQFNQAGGFRHNLGSYDHLRSECPIFPGAEFVSWQFSI